MYVNNFLGDLSPLQERQLTAARAAAAQATRNLARTDLIPKARAGWESRLAAANVKITALLNVTQPVPPAPTPTPTPTPTPVPTPTPTPTPIPFPTVPVSSPPVVTVTQTPATTEMVIDNKWLLIGGGLIALMMLK